MLFCQKTLSKAQFKCIPLLVYTKNGSLLKTYGLKNKRICSTVYHVLVKMTDQCYVFTPLFPVKYCGQFFLKKMDTTIFVNQNCILGMNHLKDIKIVNKIMIHQHFNDCIKGEFQISHGFERATIWQANLHNYTGEAKVHYNRGKDNSLLIHVIYQNDATGTYTLLKNNSITIYLSNVKSVIVGKKNLRTRANGSYSINVYGEIVKHL